MTLTASECGPLVARALRTYAKQVRRYTRHVEAGSDRAANKALRHLANGFDCRLAALVITNRRRKHPIAVERLPAIARSISLWRRCGERVTERTIRQRNGKERVVLSFGLENRARQLLLRKIVEPRVRAKLKPEQFLYRGGRGAACAYVLATLPRRAGFAAELDIKNFYPSVRVEEACRRLGLPRGLGPAVLDAACLNIVPQHTSLMVNDRHRQRGLPQGASLSPLIGEYVVSEVLRSARFGANAVYADNMLLHGGSRVEVEARRISLVAAFAQHPLGTFTLHQQNPRRLCDGVEYLGYEFRRLGGDLVARPTTTNRQRFAAKLRSIDPARIASYTSSWRSSFRLWHAVEAFSSFVRISVRHDGRLTHRNLRDLTAAFEGLVPSPASWI